MTERGTIKIYVKIFYANGLQEVKYWISHFWKSALLKVWYHFADISKSLSAFCLNVVLSCCGGIFSLKREKTEEEKYVPSIVKHMWSKMDLTVYKNETLFTSQILKKDIQMFPFVSPAIIWLAKGISFLHTTAIGNIAVKKSVVWSGGQHLTIPLQDNFCLH